MTGPNQPSETDLLVQKIKAARAEKNKKKEQEEERVPVAEPLPSIGGSKSGSPSLGGVGMRKGAFDLDPEYLKRAQPILRIAISNNLYFCNQILRILVL